MFECAQSTQKEEENGEKIDLGRTRLGKKIDRLVVYTSLVQLETHAIYNTCNLQHVQFATTPLKNEHIE